ncbi:MAG: hypothetical protein ISR44_05290 [Rhodospirillales bacterium]|nr:hypothetical protein [Rhodospirillales bacterium]
MMKIGTAIAVFSALLAVGCSVPAVWEKSDGDKAGRRADTATCKGFADAEAGRIYDRDVPGVDFGDSGVGAGFHTTMARHDAIGRRDRIFADCMKRKGYSSRKK